MRFMFLLVILLQLISLPVFSETDLLPVKQASGSFSVKVDAAAVDETPPWGLVVLMLMLGGFIFMFLEIAIIPGFGVTGILGLTLLIGGIATAYFKLTTLMAVFTTFAGLAGVGALMMWFFLVFPKTRLGKNFILETDSSVENGYIAVEDMQRYLGKEGVSVTILRPSGIAKVDGERLDVITDGQFVEKGVAVKVVKTGAGKIIVAPIESEN